MTQKERMKAAAFLMAVVMLMAMLPVRAAANALPPSTGNLIVHKYLLESVKDANGPNDGNPAGVGDNPELPEGAEPLQGITFEAIQIKVGTDGIYPDDGPYTIDLETNTLKDGSGKLFGLIDPVYTATTDADGEAKFGDIDQGIYVVIERESQIVPFPAKPFIVAVPMTNPTGDGWLKEVHTYPKNEALFIEKTASKAAVTVGEEVTYNIDVFIPSNIDEISVFEITDVLDSALTLDEATISVAFSNNKGIGFEAAQSGEFTYTTEPSFKVSVNSNGLQRMRDYKYMRLSFSVLVTEEILARDYNTVLNTASVTVDDAVLTQEIPIEVHTGTIDIIKSDMKDSSVKLPGAVFKIALSEEDAVNGVFLRKDSAGNIVSSGQTGYEAAADWEITTQADGKASFAGIRDYIEEAGIKTYQSYWVVETKAPAEYNLLTRPVQVTFTGEEAVKENSYTMGISIGNNKGFTLPQTGGIGAVLFTAGGILLIGAAVLIILIDSKKRKAGQQR